MVFEFAFIDFIHDAYKYGNLYHTRRWKNTISVNACKFSSMQVFYINTNITFKSSSNVF